MKTIFVAAFVAVATTVPIAIFAARVVELPPMPEGVLPNSEVVTNIALAVELSRLDSLSFSIELDASTANSFSIAVGAAARDMLTIEEADFEWGYDCGEWFRSDTNSGIVLRESSVDARRVSNTLTIRHGQINPQWNMIRVVKRGVGNLAITAETTFEFKKFSISLR